MKSRKILISNGVVLYNGKLEMLDILIEGGRFRRIKKGITISAPSTRVIDAKGKIVFPGIIDSHTHFGLQQGVHKTADDFETASKSALFGGVTFFIDYTMQEKGGTLKSSLSRRKAEAQGKAYIDFSFHIGITDWNEKTYREAVDLIDSGFPSFKMFQIYKDKGWQSDDEAIFDALSRLGKEGGIIEVHCENDLLVNYFTSKLIKEHHLSVRYHPLSRPDFVEGEAINRMIYLNRFAKGRLYIVHTSTELGAKAIRNAKEAGIKVFGETCPQYLKLTDSVFRKKDAELYATCPPVRKDKDIKFLWEMIDREEFDVIATDHCAFKRAQKKEERNDFRKLPFGMPGVEYNFPIIYTEGHIKRKIELRKIAKLMAENPARIFGIHGRGKIEKGYIADLFIFDPEREGVLSSKTHHHPSDYCPYEGERVYGIPETVLAKGEIKILNGELIGKKNGKLTERFTST